MKCLANHKSRPLVSIVTPSYNQGKFIEDCILSVLHQNYPHIEHIIIDGGSKDKTLDVIQKYEKYISYWISEKDKGSSDGINKGWSRAKGDYIWILNSDDLLASPTAISMLVDYSEKHPKVDFAYGDMYWIDEAGEFIGHKVFPDFDLMELVLFEGQYPCPGCLMKRELLNTVGYFDTRFRSADDLDYLFRIAFRHKMGHLKQYTGCFRIHPKASTQARLQLNAIETIRVYEKLLQSADCPTELLQRVEEIWGKAHRCAASGYFNSGHSRQTRYHILQAIKKTPKRVKSLRVLATLMMSLFGDKGMSYARASFFKYFPRRYS